MSKYKGPECLRFNGLLGHTAAVTLTDSDGKERAFAETYPEYAARTYREERDLGHSPRIYYRVRTARTHGWREVPYRVAVLDEKE